jgi:hypothetical protein
VEELHKLRRATVRPSRQDRCNEGAAKRATPTPSVHSVLVVSRRTDPLAHDPQRPARCTPARNAFRDRFHDPALGISKVVLSLGIRLLARSRGFLAARLFPGLPLRLPSGWLSLVFWPLSGGQFLGLLFDHSSRFFKAATHFSRRTNSAGISNVSLLS